MSHLEMIKGMRVSGMGAALSCEFRSFGSYTRKLMPYVKDLDTLTIPIIENTPDEEDLRFDMEKALKEYPEAYVSSSHLYHLSVICLPLMPPVFCTRFRPAVLVRRHGTYSWGPDWTKAKGQAECLDYILEVAVKMRQAGLQTEGL